MRSDIPNQDEYYRQLQQLILSLQAVTNNSPSSIGGGGTPRQPLAPCFDDEPNCPLENPPQPTVPSDGGSTGDVEPEGKIERSANFTQGVKVSASSQVSSKFSADKAVDGDETSDSSRWTSERVDGETITIDLGRQESISRIAFISAKNTTKQYKLMVSKDNSNYVMVAQGTTQEGVPTLNDQEFASQTARYIRFQGLTRWNNNYGHSIFEIGAYIDEGAIAADFTLSGVSNGEVVNRWIRVGATPSGVTDGVSFKYYVNGKEVYTAKESPYCLGGTDSKGRCWPFDLKPAGTQGKETFTFTVKMIYDDGSLTRDYTLTRK
jgi:hypothetical protein